MCFVTNPNTGRAQAQEIIMSNTSTQSTAVKPVAVRFEDDPAVVAFGFRKQSKQGHEYFSMSVLTDHLKAAQERGENEVSARFVQDGKILVMKSWKSNRSGIR